MYQKLGIQKVGDRFGRDGSLHRNDRCVEGGWEWYGTYPTFNISPFLFPCLVCINNSEMRMLVGDKNDHSSICFLYVCLLL